MHWKILATTFAAVFVAELGDKTQLMTLSLTTGTQSRWAVFLGSALALTATAGMAVLGGDLIGRLISPRWLQRIAAGTMLVMGGVLMWRAR